MVITTIVDDPDWGCGTRAGTTSRGGWILIIGLCLALGGCARQYNAYGKARQIDTIEGYEEYIRANPRDPRVKFARDRIEVLRSLDAHRSGSVSPITAGATTPARTATERVLPGNNPQGAWGLTGRIPRSSTFILDLYHGDIDPVPHTLRVDQEGERATYTLQYGYGPDRYYLTTGVAFDSFRRLWATVVASNVGSLRSSYGSTVSTADYRGNLVIEVDTGVQRLSRTIRLEGLNVRDGNLRNLLQSMAEMHPGDHRMPLFR